MIAAVAAVATAFLLDVAPGFSLEDAAEYVPGFVPKGATNTTFVEDQQYKVLPVDQQDGEDVVKPLLIFFTHPNSWCPPLSVSRDVGSL